MYQRCKSIRSKADFPVQIHPSHLGPQASSCPFPHLHTRAFTTIGNIKCITDPWVLLSPSPSSGITQVLLRPALYTSARDPNTGLHACAPSTISTKPSSNYSQVVPQQVPEPHPTGLREEKAPYSHSMGPSCFHTQALPYIYTYTHS